MTEDWGKEKERIDHTAVNKKSSDIYLQWSTIERKGSNSLEKWGGD